MGTRLNMNILSLKSCIIQMFTSYNEVSGHRLLLVNGGEAAECENGKNATGLRSCSTAIIANQSMGSR